MEKIIKISGKDVKFKTNGVALLIYKQQTGRDLIPDLFKLIGEVDIANISANNINLANLNTQVLFDICWTFAKIATPDIPPVLEWASEFDSFPIVDIFKETMELVIECITCSAKVKKEVATATLKQKAMHSKRKTSFSQLFK